MFCFFFLMIPPPPRSTPTLTLFPHPTLFRSVRPVDALARSLEWRAAHLDETTGADPFDYALEDRVKAALDELVFALDDAMVEPEVVHPYPHPRAPTLAPDHRGR